MLLYDYITLELALHTDKRHAPVPLSMWLFYPSCTMAERLLPVFHFTCREHKSGKDNTHRPWNAPLPTLPIPTYDPLYLCHGYLVGRAGVRMARGEEVGPSSSPLSANCWQQTASTTQGLRWVDEAAKLARESHSMWHFFPSCTKNKCFKWRTPPTFGTILLLHGSAKDSWLYHFPFHFNS